MIRLGLASRAWRLPALGLVLLCHGLRAQGELEAVRVETYYISDANDATDETGGLLVAGSRTYRVFVDLGEGCSLLALYGDTNHVLSISSTQLFFNNIDRGEVFGHQIPDNRLDENTVALDSWLSLGRASNQRFGIEKVDDTDGSIVGGTNNDGGSAGITGGLLVNAEATPPLTEKDGLLPLTGAPAIPPGFFQLGDDPGGAFGEETLLSAFATHDFTLGCTSPGVVGATSDNVVLIAQLTTAGELEFALNLLILRPDGSVARFVASDSVLVGEEQVHPQLTYPPQCGCTDPDFLEFDPSAACDDGSCSTLIVFGCMDTLACNFDPDANINIAQLCCYGPSNCNGLDVTVVCPQVGIEEEDPARLSFDLFPNPTRGELRLTIRGASSELAFTIMDAAGRLLQRTRLLRGSSDFSHDVDVTGLAPGAYRLVIEGGGVQVGRFFIKQ